MLLLVFKALLSAGPPFCLCVCVDVCQCLCLCLSLEKNNYKLYGLSLWAWLSGLPPLTAWLQQVNYTSDIGDVSTAGTFPSCVDTHLLRMSWSLDAPEALITSSFFLFWDPFIFENLFQGSPRRLLQRINFCSRCLLCVSDQLALCIWILNLPVGENGAFWMVSGNTVRDLKVQAC